MPFQWDWALQQAGISVAEAEQAVWAVPHKGDKKRGAAAVNEVIDAVLGVHVFRGLYNLPLIGAVQDSIYSFVAANRSHFPGTTPALDRLEGWRPQR